MLDHLVLQMPVFDAEHNPTKKSQQVLIREAGNAIQIARGKGDARPALEIEVTKTGLRVFQYPSLGDDPVVVLEFDTKKTRVSSNLAGSLDFDEVNLEHDNH